MEQLIADDNSSNEMNNAHQSFLVPFFEAMNENFSGQWCVLHSYENLPFYSESDVDMAFSGANAETLDKLVSEVAQQSGWLVCQKLWYDVQTCFYYVLRESRTGELLAIDFLMDIYGIGRYGLKTTILTQGHNTIHDLIPIPRHEAALSYKIIKRIEKERALTGDEDYLRNHYRQSDKQEISSILDQQYGTRGKQLLLDYLDGNRGALADSDMVVLKKERKKRIFNLITWVRFNFWEMRRVLFRIKRPSGMIVNIPAMEEQVMRAFTDCLRSKVGILFRNVKLDLADSKIDRLKGITGSTLVVCPQSNFNIFKTVNYHWISPKYLSPDGNQNLVFEDLDTAADVYFEIILKALSLRANSNKYTYGQQ